MIARRRPLRVEIGYRRLAEMQEEILCALRGRLHSGHFGDASAPTSSSKRACRRVRKSRTAAMAERAGLCHGCNKAYNVVRAVEVLDDLLR